MIDDLGVLELHRGGPITAIMGLLLDHGMEECLPNGECSFPRGVA